MDCPRCDRETTLRKFGEVQVDICGRCGGMFLDRGELNKIATHTSGDLEYSTVHQESFEHGDRFDPTSCPRCDDVEMKKVEFNIHTGVILDYCPDCGGFWLDRNELDRINKEVRELNRSAGEAQDPPMLWFARFIWGLPR